MTSYEDTRINKLRLYLFNIINVLKTDSKYQINANMLSNDINNYSLDKLPTSSEVEKWINGTEIHRDAFSFRSRMSYSQDVVNNLANIGFFEDFEKLILNNNRQGILPDIEGIQKIECFNSASMIDANSNKATFEIQIEITYSLNVINEQPVISL